MEKIYYVSGSMGQDREGNYVCLNAMGILASNENEALWEMRRSGIKNPRIVPKSERRNLRLPEHPLDAQI